MGKSNERIYGKLSNGEILRLYLIVHVAMETTKTSNFTRQSITLSSVYFSLAKSQLVSCNLSLATFWQMTYTKKLPKLCSATLITHWILLTRPGKNLWKQPHTPRKLPSFGVPLPSECYVALHGEKKGCGYFLELHILFYSLCKEMKQQMEEQTTIFVQITYKSQHQVPRHISVVPKHMADICTSEYLAVTKCWLSARLKFIH